MHDLTSRIQRVEYTVRDLSYALRRVGLSGRGRELGECSSELVEVADNLRRSTAAKVQEDYDQATNMSGVILGTLLPKDKQAEGSCDRSE